MHLPNLKLVPLTVPNVIFGEAVPGYVHVPFSVKICRGLLFVGTL